MSGLDKDGIRKRITAEYCSGKSVPSVRTSMLEKFARTMKKGDTVLTYDSGSREYRLAKIVGDYKWLGAKSKSGRGDQRETKAADELQLHSRKVEWNTKSVSRDLLSEKAKNSLGSTLTLFSVNDGVAKEFEDILEGRKRGNAVGDDEFSIETRYEDLFEKSLEILKDKINSLSWEEMEELAKEILNAMGYIAQRTPKGRDGGVDVIASKDRLGLEDPRIFVQVKHRKEKTNSDAIKAFIGGRKNTDKCVFVSTSGFTADAKKAAEHSNVTLTLVDSDLLAELVSLHYDNFSAAAKQLLPLKKFYLPEGGGSGRI